MPVALFLSTGDESGSQTAGDTTARILTGLPVEAKCAQGLVPATFTGETNEAWHGSGSLRKLLAPET